ncbi:MAG: ABC transporter permease [Acidimicrobiales bacterium]
MIRFSLARMRATRRRTAGLAIAIAVGVAFLVGTLALGDTLRAGFRSGYVVTNAGTDLVVRGGSATGNDVVTHGPVERALSGEVVAVDGVDAVGPEIIGSAQLVGADGNVIGGNGPPVVGSSWQPDPRFTPWRIVEGRAPEADGEVVIDEATATAGDLDVGSSSVLLTPAVHPVTVVGVAAFADPDAVAPNVLIAGTLDDAGRWFDAGTGVSDIRVAYAPDADGASVRAAVEAVVPPGAAVISGPELAEEQYDAIAVDFLDSFTSFLTVFAGVALVVAAFSIGNTFAVVTAQRSRESAMLRSIGASRRQIVAGALIEATVIGTLASLVGVVAGIGVGYALHAVVDQVFNGLGSTLVVTATTVVAGVVVGVVSTVVAATVPAVTGSRVRPVAAMGETEVEPDRVSRLRVGVGTVGLIVGVGLVAAATRTDSTMTVAGLGSLVVVVAAVMLGPVVIIPAARTIGWPLARSGVTGELARNNTVRNPRRSSGTAAALMLGVAVVTLFTVVASSAQATIDETVRRNFGGDLVVSTPGFSGAGLDPALASELEGLPEVDVAADVSFVSTMVDGRAEDLTVADLARLTSQIDLGAVDADLATLGPDQIAVGVRYAEEHGLQVGDAVTVGRVDGPVELTVAATFDNELLFSALIGPASAWEGRADPRISLVDLIGLADGVSTEAGRDAVAAVVEAGSPGAMVETRDEFLESQADAMNSALGLIYGLLGVSVVIALIGISNALGLAVHERRRELGLLRAVGQTRRQVRATVRGEAVIVAVFGTVGGIALGTGLGWGLVRALAAEGLGQMTVPVLPLALVAVVGAVVGVVAAVRPARRAARVDILDALVST